MKRALITLAAVALVPAAVAAGKVKVWHHHSPAHYDKADVRQAVLTTDGAVRLARRVRPLTGLEAAHVWALAEDAKGNLYVGTGHDGKLFKVTPDERVSLVYQSEDSQILSLAVAADGTVYAGTGPSGRVVRVSPTGETKLVCKLGEAYVWALAFDARGEHLYAGTGPHGKILRVSGDGQVEPFYTTKQDHVLALAVAADGQVYAGTGGSGLVYRITPQGKGFVLFDAPQSEVRSLLLTPEGLYAGTSAPTGRRLPGSAASLRERGDNGLTSGVRLASHDRQPASAGDAPSKGSSSGGSGGSSAPSLPPPSGKENSVYRLGADGSVRELFRDKLMVLGLGRRGGQLLVATGGDGQLFEVRPGDRERTEIARLDHTHVHCLCQRKDGSLVLGAGDPGKLYVLEDAFAKSGTVTSEVQDAKGLSRWGAVRWQAECPKGTRVTVAVRSGNVAVPDDTWSDWSAELTAAETATVPAPAARFLQYRVTLASEEAKASPTLQSLYIRYQPVNVAPEVGSIEVPDLDAGSADNGPKVRLKWTATDANEDELTYTVFYRKQGWQHWVELESGLDKREYEWDTATTPAGVYQVKVVASDRRDNPEEEALSGERVSAPFIVDHVAPAVSVKVAGWEGDRAVIEATAADELTRLVAAAYSVDSRKWASAFPTDGLFDGKAKTFRFRSEPLKAGTHVVVVRVTDAAGNVGTADVVFQAPGK